jgi:hypothetical protein
MYTSFWSNLVEIKKLNLAFLIYLSIGEKKTPAKIFGVEMFQTCETTQPDIPKTSTYWPFPQYLLLPILKMRMTKSNKDGRGLGTLPVYEFPSGHL